MTKPVAMNILSFEIKSSWEKWLIPGTRNVDDDPGISCYESQEGSYQKLQGSHQKGLRATLGAQNHRYFRTKRGQRNNLIINPPTKHCLSAQHCTNFAEERKDTVILSMISITVQSNMLASSHM